MKDRIQVRTEDGHRAEIVAVDSRRDDLQCLQRCSRSYDDRWTAAVVRESSVRATVAVVLVPRVAVLRLVQCKRYRCMWTAASLGVTGLAPVHSRATSTDAEPTKKRIFQLKPVQLPPLDSGRCCMDVFRYR